MTKKSWHKARQPTATSLDEISSNGELIFLGLWFKVVIRQTFDPHTPRPPTAMAY